MRLKEIAALSAVALLAGCAGGPGALPALYGQRDAITRVIEDIEDKYQVAPRPNLERPEEEKTKTNVAQLQEENYRLREELEEMNRDWFKNLNTDQQLQWKMHRDLLSALARTDARPPIPSYLQPQTRPAGQQGETPASRRDPSQPVSSAPQNETPIGPPAIDNPGN